uniref:HAMP domain-containing histidine kinase n=1 Tax=Anisakis simplex TaxID=6269 RepID=A0A0M3JAX9_ANISI
LQQILPVIREAATIAREAVRACSVFTAWSRELGDRIRTLGLDSETLMGFADELQIRFGQRLLANHWLPPSLTPLLRIAAIALRQNIETKQVERTSIGSNTELTVDTIGFMESELQSLRRQRDAKQVFV